MFLRGPGTLAVTPAPDGGYPGGNTVEGSNALHGLTRGTYNTANGLNTLFTDTTGSFNTATGVQALYGNNGSYNTATGANALYRNTIGNYNTANGAQALFNNIGSFNTAVGINALYKNQTGNYNTATGAQALFSNTSGPFNTAIGNAALFNNTSGDRNTAVGESAMLGNTTGASNSALGVSALRNNTTGNYNTAVGHDALVNNSVSGNTAVGFRAAYSNSNGTSNTAIGYAALLANSTGYENTAVGAGALQGNPNGNLNTAIGTGALQATANAGCTAIGWHAGATGTGIGNIYIGAGIDGPPNELGVTRIANIYSTGAASGRAVYVTSDNIVGTLVSSRRYKDEIKSMAETSEAIFSLRPVSFRYKKQIDPAHCLSFGLIAEEVAEVDPDLVTSDRDGKPETVRYEAINAMLLNEFLKEHRKVEEQRATIAQVKAILAIQGAAMAEQRKTVQSKLAQQEQKIEALTATLKEQASQIRKVSNQMKLVAPVPQLATNEH